MFRLLAAAAVVLGLVLGAPAVLHAQTVTHGPGDSIVIRPPGGAPTTVTPAPGGAVIVETPGQAPRQVMPDSDGRYRIRVPGAATTVLEPEGERLEIVQ